MQFAQVPMNCQADTSNCVILIYWLKVDDFDFEIVIVMFYVIQCYTSD